MADSFEVGVVAEFEAAHRLRGDFGPATRTHGHTYRVEVTVSGPTLKEDGSLCDLGIVQAAVDAAVGGLHYQDLDALPLFEGRNSTAEQVARVLADLIRPRLAGERVSQLAVRVWESPHAFASYRCDF